MPARIRSRLILRCLLMRSDMHWCDICTIHFYHSHSYLAMSIHETSSLIEFAKFFRLIERTLVRRFHWKFSAIFWLKPYDLERLISICSVELIPLLMHFQIWHFWLRAESDAYVLAFITRFSFFSFADLTDRNSVWQHALREQAEPVGIAHNQRLNITWTCMAFLQNPRCQES
jgi:hypothetical protein